MSNCTDCLIDLTDACPRGCGRAIDNEICDSFFSRETYEVNKNESWQLGYQQGRADAIDECIELLKEKHYCFGKTNYTQAVEDLKFLKEQNNG